MVGRTGGCDASQLDIEASPAIFAEVVPVHVCPSKRDEFSAALTIRLRPDNPAHPRTLSLELTDEADYLFYHSLILGEGDFHALKAEQRLRVDFQSFPMQLVELLRRCILASSSSLAERASDGSVSGSTGVELRMRAQLECCAGGDSLFTIVESTQFRELTHISLRLRQGTDEVVKRHLASKLRSATQEAADLGVRLKSREEQLAQRNREVDELAARARVVGEERLHLERSMEASHQREMAELRQEHARVVGELRQAASQECSRFEAESARNLAAANSRASAAERLCDDFQQRLQASQSLEKSATSRLGTVEAELKQQLLETTSLREQVKQLELCKFQHERELAELKMQVSGLRGELAGKDQLVTNQTAQLETQFVARRALEDSLTTVKQHASSLEEKFTQATLEITKGNQIIQTMHASMKQLKSKLKLKDAEVKRREKLALEHERAEEMHKHTLLDKEGELTRGREREARCQSEAEELRKRLSEAHEVLKTNQDVIEYLNKQLTERDLKGFSSVGGLLGSTAATVPDSRGLGATINSSVSACVGSNKTAVHSGVLGLGGGMLGCSGTASQQLGELLRRVDGPGAFGWSTSAAGPDVARFRGPVAYRAPGVGA